MFKFGKSEKIFRCEMSGRVLAVSFTIIVNLLFGLCSSLIFFSIPAACSINFDLVVLSSCKSFHGCNNALIMHMSKLHYKSNKRILKIPCK